jgi:hypothetical protein
MHVEDSRICMRVVNCSPKRRENVKTNLLGSLRSGCSLIYFYDVEIAHRKYNIVNKRISYLEHDKNEVFSNLPNRRIFVWRSKQTYVCNKKFLLDILYQKCKCINARTHS